MLVELTNEMEECLPSGSSVEEETNANLLVELLNKFLFSKAEDKRNIFIRRYWYLDTVSEIAKRFGLSESNVKTTLFRMRAELREFLEEQGIEV